MTIPIRMIAVYIIWSKALVASLTYFDILDPF